MMSFVSDLASPKAKPPVRANEQDVYLLETFCIQELAKYGLIRTTDASHIYRCLNRHSTDDEFLEASQTLEQDFGFNHYFQKVQHEDKVRSARFVSIHDFLENYKQKNLSLTAIKAFNFFGNQNKKKSQLGSLGEGSESEEGSADETSPMVRKKIGLKSASKWKRAALKGAAAAAAQNAKNNASNENNSDPAADSKIIKSGGGGSKWGKLKALKDEQVRDDVNKSLELVERDKEKEKDREIDLSMVNKNKNVTSPSLGIPVPLSPTPVTPVRTPTKPKTASSSSSSSSSSTSKKSEKKAIERFVICSSRFETTKKNRLNFAKGDVIQVIRDDKAMKWHAGILRRSSAYKLDGKVGFYPPNFVRPYKGSDAAQLMGTTGLSSSSSTKNRTSTAAALNTRSPTGSTESRASATSPAGTRTGTGSGSANVDSSSNSRRASTYNSKAERKEKIEQRKQNAEKRKLKAKANLKLSLKKKQTEIDTPHKASTVATSPAKGVESRSS